MAKKKKVNTSHLQKIEAAQHRNEYIKRLQQFCNQVTSTPIFQFIPSKDLDELYKLRIHPIKVRAARGYNVSPDSLKEARNIVYSHFKDKTVILNIGNAHEVALYDFMTYGMSLLLYTSTLPLNKFPKADVVKQELSPFLSFLNSETYHQAWQEYFNIIDKISFLKSDISKGVYVINHTEDCEHNGTTGLFFFFEVYCAKSSKIQISIDGITRPAYQVGWLVPDEKNELSTLSINLSNMGEPENKLYDVYIQSHALERLSERVDGVNKGLLHFSIYDSLKNAVITKNKKGDWLFEYKLLGKRVGYFKGDVIDDKIVLRTFLFLTNNGTPEGEKLHEHTGIMKEDKIYLTIDKFSSFVHSDIKHNVRVMDIFIKAGCQSLFEVDTELFAKQGEEKSLATLIESYLNKAA